MSCQPGMYVMSCGYASKDVDHYHYDAFPGLLPVNNTSCECSNWVGITCAARCVNHPVLGYEIVMANDTGSVRPTCPVGKKVLGCHMNPTNFIYVYDPLRYFYPSDNGSSCVCNDDAGAACYATCVSDIKDYEIVTAHGDAADTFVSCKITGNVVMGCGQKSDDSPLYDHWTKMYITDQTTCLCSNNYGIVCYAICGKLNY